MSSDPLNATVLERRDLTPALAIVRVGADAGEVPEFEPGQFITLGLPGAEPVAGDSPRTGRGPRLVRRAYSIASAPSQRHSVELFITLVEQGKLTPRLWDLPAGGRLWMDSKCSGHFTLDSSPLGSNAPDLVFVATGTGVAPFISMIRHYRGQQRWRRLAVLHGVRLPCDLGYHHELSRYSAQDADLCYIPCVTREPDGTKWIGWRGRVQSVLEPQSFAHLTGWTLDPAHAHVYLCGNPAMIDEVQAQLTRRGFTVQTRQTPGNLHFERYW